MLKRKLSAKTARSILLEDFNDIDIYVEDSAEGYKKMYKELINKVLGNQFKIEHILPVGKRDDVIRECEKNQNHIGRKRVYIIDGDLSLLTDEKPIPLQGLYILPRYCFENFLIDSEAIVKIINEIELELEIEQIEAKLNYENWVLENEKPLIDLFIVYSLCFEYGLNIQTVKFKVTKLCSDPSGVVCPEKVQFRIEVLRKALIENIGAQKASSLIKNRRKKIYSEENMLLRYVSGKDYLLPLLFSRIRNCFKSTGDKSNLKMRLAFHSNPKELKNLPDFFIN